MNDFSESIGEIELLRDGLSEKLLARGVSRSAIVRMRKDLREIQGDPFKHHSARAIYFACRFSEAISSNDMPSSMQFAIKTARAAQHALDYESAKIEQGWSRYFRRENAKHRHSEMRSVVESKIRAKRGNVSAKSVHAWCEIERSYGMKLRRFQNWWSSERMAEFVGRIRKESHV